MKDITLNIHRFDDVEMGMKVNIGADTRDFIQEIKNVRSELERMGETVEKSSSVVGKSYAYQGNQLKGLRNAIKNIQKEYNNLRDTAKKYYGTKYTTNTFEGSTTKKISNAIFSQNKKGLQNYESINDPARLTSLLEQVTKDFNSLFSDVQNQLTSQGKKVNQELEKEIVNTEKLNAKLKETPQSVKKNETAISHFAKKIKEINKMQNSVSTGFKNIINRFKSGMVALRLIGTAIKSTWNQMSSMVEEATSYTESLNLYTVALGEYAEQGRKWADKISNALYLDPNNIMQYTGALFNLTRGLGVASDDAYTMSTNLTQLAYDMSSYLNIDVEAAYTKLQSAMTGQSRAVASAGVALQVASLQQLAYSMGIKKSVSDMTQAEKTYLRYIQIMRSTSNMQGDLARTIITPANAIRVLKNQFTLLSRAVGNIFVPIIMKAIPYVMALTKVLQDLAARIASFLGVKIGWSSTEIDYSGLKLADTYLEDVGDTASSTGSKVGKAVKQIKDELGNLASFDELNVITFNDDTTSGSGGTGGIGGVGGGGNILPILQEEIDGYDMLAGLTSQFDKQVENAKNNLDSFLDVIKKIGIAIAAWKLLKSANNLITFGEALSASWKNGTGLAGALKSLLSWIGLLTPSGLSITTMFETLKGKLANVMIALSGNNSAFNTFAKVIGKAALGVSGFITFFSGRNGLVETMKDATKESLRTGSSMKEAFKDADKDLIKMTAGATALGAAIGGPVGAAIGGLTGLLLGAQTAINANKKAMFEYGQELVYGNVTISQEQWNEILKSATGRTIDFTRELENLKSTLEGNYSSFEKSIQQLDLYSYKFGFAGQKISNEEATKIFSAIENVVTESTNIIDSTMDLQLKAWTDGFKHTRGVADIEQQTILSSVMEYGDKQKAALKTAQDNITQTYDTAIKARGYLTDKERKYIAEQLDKIRKLTTSSMTASQSEIEYYKQLFSDKNLRIDKESYANYKKAREQYYEDEYKSIKTQNELMNASAKQRYDEGLIDYKQYQNELKIAAGIRVEAEEKVKEDLNRIQNEIITNLKLKYIELQGATDEVSKGTRSEIEKIFKDLNIDTSELEKQVATASNQTRITFEKAWYDGKPQGYFQVIADTTGASKTVNDFLKNTKNSSSMFKNMTIVPIVGGKTPAMNFSKIDFTKKAGGGYVDSGDFFFANENGVPEYITSIGNKSAVVNQTQMVTALTNAIVQGLSNMNPPQNNEPVNIYIGNDKVYSGFINYAKRQNNIYGTNVIRI